MTRPHNAPKSTPSHSPEPRLLYDRKAAATQLSISVRSLDYLIQQQQISTRRIGKKVLIQRTELSRFSRGNHTAPIRKPKK
jgi:hypothetical protein